MKTPRLLVFNKADKAGPIARGLAGRENGVAVSALHKQGFEALLGRVERTLWAEGKPERAGEEPQAAEPPLAGPLASGEGEQPVLK